MSCLCYCICRHPGPEVAGPLWGVADRPVYRLNHRQLSAAVSRIAAGEQEPDLAGIRAYARVVDCYHRQGPVIPLRFGCVLPRESQVIRFLDERLSQYETLLQELEDCVEMGLRVLLPQASLAGVCRLGPDSGREAAGPPPAAGRPGLAYLTARKAHYAHQDRLTGEYRRAAELCRAQFAGLYLKCKTEPPAPRLPLLSLHFLVPRANEVAFRQAFRRLGAAAAARLLLSGPWPPYNFVTGESGLRQFPQNLLRE